MKAVIKCNLMKYMSSIGHLKHFLIVARATSCLWCFLFVSPFAILMTSVSIHLSNLFKLR